MHGWEVGDRFTRSRRTKLCSRVHHWLCCGNTGLSSGDFLWTPTPPPHNKRANDDMYRTLTVSPHPSYTRLTKALRNTILESAGGSPMRAGVHIRYSSTITATQHIKPVSSTATMIVYDGKALKEYSLHAFTRQRNAYSQFTACSDRLAFDVPDARQRPSEPWPVKYSHIDNRDSRVPC